MVMAAIQSSWRLSWKQRCYSLLALVAMLLASVASNAHADIRIGKLVVTSQVNQPLQASVLVYDLGRSELNQVEVIASLEDMAVQAQWAAAVQANKRTQKLLLITTDRVTQDSGSLFLTVAKGNTIRTRSYDVLRPKPARVAQASARPATTGNTTNNTGNAWPKRLTVQANESLWIVAQRLVVAPGVDVDVYATMQALVEANPRVFQQGIQKLQAGQSLVVPPLQKIAAIDRNAARQWLGSVTVAEDQQASAAASNEVNAANQVNQAVRSTQSPAQPEQPISPVQPVQPVVPVPLGGTPGVANDQTVSSSGSRSSGSSAGNNQPSTNASAAVTSAEWQHLLLLQQTSNADLKATNAALTKQISGLQQSLREVNQQLNNVQQQIAAMPVEAASSSARNNTRTGLTTGANTTASGQESPTPINVSQTTNRATGASTSTSTNSPDGMLDNDNNQASASSANSAVADAQGVQAVQEAQEVQEVQQAQTQQTKHQHQWPANWPSKYTQYWPSHWPQEWLLFALLALVGLLLFGLLLVLLAWRRLVRARKRTLRESAANTPLPVIPAVAGGANIASATSDRTNDQVNDETADYQQNPTADADSDAVDDFIADDMPAAEAQKNEQDSSEKYVLGDEYLAVPHPDEEDEAGDDTSAKSEQSADIHYAYSGQAGNKAGNKPKHNLADTSESEAELSDNELTDITYTAEDAASDSSAANVDNTADASADDAQAEADLSTTSSTSADGSGASMTVEETAMQIDLARAYVAMGETESAREVLRLVMQSGDASLVDEAQDLLVEL